MLRILAFLLFAAFVFVAPKAEAQSEEAAQETSAAEAPRRGPSGLPLPRFVTLRSSEVNLRTGPGVRYPIDWVYQREGLPIQVIDEFEAWRRIRDRDDTVGWVHQSMLSGRRSVIVIGEILALREDPLESAGTLAYLEPGFQAKLESCPTLWCEVTAQGPQGQRYRGWLPRLGLWGLLDGEIVE